MSAYSEFRYYSPVRDRNEIRLSMTNANNEEYYFVLADEDGKRYRARRDTALEAISEAIAANLKPGRVLIRGDI